MNQRTTWAIIGGSVTLLLCCGLALLIGGVRWYAASADDGRPLARASATPHSVVATLRARPSPTPLPTRGPQLPPTWTPVGGSAAPAPTPAAEATAAPPADLPPLDPSAPLADLSLGLAPAFRGELAARPDVPLYRIRARFEPATRELVGRQWVRWTNREGVALNELYLRLYPNASFYMDGELAVSGLTINGQPIAPVSEVEGTALRLPLPAPLAPGEAAELLLDFTLIIPLGGGYGILGQSDGIYSLYNWHPEVAVYEGGGWLLNPVTSQGDPTNTDIANYEVEVAIPEGWRLVSGGVEQQEGTLVRIVAPLTRNLVLLASDRLAESSRSVGEVTVNSYYRPGSEQAGETVLDVTADSLAVLGEQFGAYPYAEMDATEAGLSGGAAGMESTGLILIGSPYYSGESDPLAGLGGLIEGIEIVPLLDYIVAHEVAHQWWYGLVGSDAYRHPWLDESLTNWSSALYFERARGEAAGMMVRDIYIALPYYLMLQEGEDQVLDQDVEAFDEVAYSAVVYGKGSILYDVLREQLGDEAFFDFLRRYYERFRFERSTPEGWRSTLAEGMGEAEASAFFDKWVLGDAITTADLPPPGPMGAIFLGDGLFDP